MLNFLKSRTQRNKERNAAKLALLRMEGDMIRRALGNIAAVSNDVEVIDATDVAAIVKAISPSGFEYRVDLFGANEIYQAITLKNYMKLANGIGHLEEEDEFMVALCLIDKCEEFGDYETMVRVFNFFEYVVRHNRTNSPTVVFAREYNIKMRRYLSDLGLL